MNNLPATVAQMKAEILADIVAGKVPATVASFSELHDYVDANEYGGFCDDEQSGLILELQGERDSLDEEGLRNWRKAGELDELQEQYTAFTNAAQNAVDEWLKAGITPKFTGVEAMQKELIALRISVARIAQSIGVDNELKVTGKPYEQLVQLAQSQDRGWNSLACLANDAIHTHYTLKA